MMQLRRRCVEQQPEKLRSGPARRLRAGCPARPDCRVEYDTQNFTTVAKKCNEVSVEDCFSLAIPQYSVVGIVYNNSIGNSV